VREFGTDHVRGVTGVTRVTKVTKISEIIYMTRAETMPF
jgi:hypothetical protein